MSELPTEPPSVWETSATLFQRWRDGESVRSTTSCGC